MYLGVAIVEPFALPVVFYFSPAISVVVIAVLSAMIVIPYFRLTYGLLHQDRIFSDPIRSDKYRTIYRQMFFVCPYRIKIDDHSDKQHYLTRA